MEKVIEEMGRFLWRRRAFYLSLTLFLSLMIAFTNTETLERSMYLGLSVVFLAFCSILSYISVFYVFKREFDTDSVWQRSVDFAVFISISWLVGTVTFYHLIPTNSLSLSYLIAFICGIIGGGIPYCIHWVYSPYHLMGYTPLIDEQFKQKDKIAQIVIHGNMWEYLAVGIIPFVIAIIKC